MDEFNELKCLFNSANKIYLLEQKNLIQRGVSERTLCGQLMLYLNKAIEKTKYDQYYVDVEYNRNFNRKIKTIVNGRGEIITINCDLIIHSRGENIHQDNLIAIEMKKSTGSRVNKERDKERLKALTTQVLYVFSDYRKQFPEHVFGYILGIYYEIDIRHMKVFLEFYQDGKLIDEENINI
ncbi:hypothetical protein [Fictibacillus sp. FJAT-27399]|uniref:hypothetical protein n=1 Tax=Fictibacillus sp. FJAT-27399 TaxID=1729689 RepID=UPI0007854A0D|nr:hypothetical protein [Fictibacillus sp. FJAT-27399]